jgi:hypothetical protein
MDVMTQTQETSQAIIVAPPFVVPLIVREEPKRKGPQVEVRQISNLENAFEVRPKPGHVVTRFVLAKVDPVTKMCQVAVWTEPRRGRPRKARPEEN